MQKADGSNPRQNPEWLPYPPGPCWFLRATVSSSSASSLSEELELELELELEETESWFAGRDPVHRSQASLPPGTWSAQASLVTQGRRMRRPAKAQWWRVAPQGNVPHLDCLLRSLQEKDYCLLLTSPSLPREPADQVGLLARLSSQLRTLLN